MQKTENALRFATINGAAAEIGVPASRLRDWVKQGRVGGFYSGSRYMVNLAQLQEALERGDFAKPEAREGA